METNIASECSEAIENDSPMSTAAAATATLRKSRRQIKPPRRLEDETIDSDLDRPKRRRKSKRKQPGTVNEEDANGAAGTCTSRGGDGGDGASSSKNSKKDAKNEKGGASSASTNISSGSSTSNGNGRRSSNSKKSNVRKTKQGNTYIIKPKQIHTTNIDISEYEDGVEISNATAQQISKSLKKPPQFKPSKALQQQFIQIPSHTCRAKIYLECARAIAQKESKALPSQGARPWQCFVTVYDRQGSRATASSYIVKDDLHGNYECSKNKGSGGSKGGGKKGGMATSPLFVWNKNRLELAVLPHILDVVDVIDTNHGLLRSVQEDIESMEVENSDGTNGGTRTSTTGKKKKAKDLTEDEEEQLYIEELITRSFTELSTVAFSDPTFVIPTVERKWISPNLVTFKSRNAAIEHSLMILDRDKLVDRVLHGIGSRGALLRAVKPTRKLALDAGYWRFERDGLWVIGQEEDWIEERLNLLKAEEDGEDEDVGLSQESQEKAGLNPKQNDDVSSRRSIGNEGQHRGEQTQSAKINHDAEENQGAIHEHQSTSSEKGQGLLTLPSPQKSSDTITEELSSTIAPPNEISDDSVSEQFDQVEHNRNPIKSSIAYKVQKSLSGNDSDVDNVQKGSPVKCSVVYDVQRCLPEKDLGVDDAQRSSLDKDSVVYDVHKGSEIVNINVPCTTVSNDLITESKPTKKRRRQYKITASNHWRLNKEQIDLCYSAIMKHYEKVMYTVRAKALHSELADGFDVFRERGRGRYDMQLEEFDALEFSFLTDLASAAWMPVVKKILGDDATMVHKGAFLSMPGSETQIYHQDGVHLNKKFQKPCHAINVFIPLVDLNEKNGPTEFCIGTHFLGFDAYAKEMVDIPLAPAGTPIIFDYRLGHRGLGNSSREPRPIVYLTYTKSSKEFRDSVNFSSKKWRKLGEIVEKPLSRQERALKRMRED